MSMDTASNLLIILLAIIAVALYGIVGVRLRMSLRLVGIYVDNLTRVSPRRNRGKLSRIYVMLRRRGEMRRLDLTP
jgi:hypothetical protein